MNSQKNIMVIALVLIAAGVVWNIYSQDRLDQTIRGDSENLLAQAVALPVFDLLMEDLEKSPELTAGDLGKGITRKKYSCAKISCQCADAEIVVFEENVCLPPMVGLFDQLNEKCSQVCGGSGLFADLGYPDFCTEVTGSC